MEYKMEEILLISKKLFYEKGYNNTSFSMIAKEISSSRSAIAFFFSNKFNLAYEIYAKISRERKERIAGELYKRNCYDRFLATAIDQRVMLNACRTDEKFRRFLCELNEKSVGVSLQNRLDRYITAEAKSLSMEESEMTEQLLKLHNVTSRGAHIMLLVYYFSKGLSNEVDFDFFCEYYIECSHFLYRFDESKSTEIIRKSEEIFNQMNVTYSPYFEFTTNW